MVNNRAKCLVISQIVKAKLYNSCLIFIYKFYYYYYVVQDHRKMLARATCIRTGCALC